MNRILGLDIGTKRIGISISDGLLLTAQPLPTLLRKPEDAALNKIQEYIKYYDVKTVVAGLPLNMNGEQGAQAEDCVNFSNKIKQKNEIDVIFIDERLTSFQAEEILREQGVKYTKDKGKVDQVAAMIILQEHLDKIQRS